MELEDLSTELFRPEPSHEEETVDDEITMKEEVLMGHVVDEESPVVVEPHDRHDK